MLDSSAPVDPASTISPFLRRLLDETADLIDSPAFSRVLTHLLDTAFTHLVDVKIAAGAYHIPPTSVSATRTAELVAPAAARAKLATALAVFCRQAHAIGAGAANEYLEAVERVPDLEAFAAVVYSGNFSWEEPELEGRRRDAAGARDAAAAAAAAAAADAAESLDTRPGTATTAAATATPVPDATPAVRPAVSKDDEVDDALLVGAPPAVAAADPSLGAFESASAEPPPLAEADMEAAWGKALAKEDGREGVAGATVS